MVELLVVIGIIAILAAIIFPVFGRVKDSAYRSSDISNMNSIRTALQLYRTDQGAYPVALLGYVTLYETGPNAGNVVPANQLQAALYPKRIDSLETLRPNYDRLGENANSVTTGAVWPSGQVVSMAGQPAQRFGPTDAVLRCVNGAATPSQFYKVSGYDVADVKSPSGTRTELHYSLFWSGWTVPQNPCSPDPSTEMGSSSDDPRQLGYTEPPETTVVTWDSFFRDYDANGTPTRSGKRDIVLFLSGSAKPYDSLDVSSMAWQVKP